MTGKSAAAKSRAEDLSIAARVTLRKNEEEKARQVPEEEDVAEQPTTSTAAKGKKGKKKEPASEKKGEESVPVVEKGADVGGASATEKAVKKAELQRQLRELEAEVVEENPEDQIARLQRELEKERSRSKKAERLAAEAMEGEDATFAGSKASLTIRGLTRSEACLSLSEEKKKFFNLHRPLTRTEADGDTFGDADFKSMVRAKMQPVLTSPVQFLSPVVVFLTMNPMTSSAMQTLAEWATDYEVGDELPILPGMELVRDVLSLCATMFAWFRSKVRCGSIVSPYDLSRESFLRGAPKATLLEASDFKTVTAPLSIKALMEASGMVFPEKEMMPQGVAATPVATVQAPVVVPPVVQPVVQSSAPSATDLLLMQLLKEMQKKRGREVHVKNSGTLCTQCGGKGHQGGCVALPGFNGACNRCGGKGHKRHTCPSQE